MIAISDFDIGVYLYTESGALGSAIYKKFGTRVRVVPIGNSVARAISTRAGSTQFWKSCSAYLACIEGVSDFATIEWGPQPLRLIYTVNREVFFSPAVAADSGIKTMDDAKGKRVAWMIGNPTINLQIEAWLAFAGLTTDDVELVEFPGYSAGLRGMIAGAVDVCATTPTNPVAMEQAGSPHGLSWIPFPESDVEGWKRMREIAPFLVPITLTKGIGITPEHPVTATSYPCPNIVAWEDQDEGLSYWFAKLIVETYDEYKDATATLGWWELENCIGPEYMSLPYHEGAVKYFKEIGVWTDELEKRQQEFLNRQKVLGEAFEAAKAEFVESGLKAKEFPSFWANKRIQALKAAGLLVWG